MGEVVLVLWTFNVRKGGWGVGTGVGLGLGGFVVKEVFNTEVAEKHGDARIKHAMDYVPAYFRPGLENDEVWREGLYFCSEV